MNKLYSALQLMHFHRLACETMGISSVGLAGFKAEAFAELFCSYYTPTQHVYLFAGYADNGAVTLAVAEILVQRGYTVDVYLFTNQGDVSPECRELCQRLKGLNIPVQEIVSQFAPPRVTSEDVLIDGLFGYELTHVLQGGFVALFKWMNAQTCEVVSLDLPSGQFADNTVDIHRSNIVKASRTITFDAPHLSMLMSESTPYVGAWHLCSLRIDQSVYDAIPGTHTCVTSEYISSILLKRSSFSKKSDFGRALIIGGENGRYGLLSCATRASLFAGIGELHVSTKLDGLAQLSTSSPEAILLCPEGDNYPIPDDLRASYRAIAVGVATHRDAFRAEDLRAICSSYRHPLVLDNTAIELLAQEPSLLPLIPEKSILLLNQRAREELLGLHFSDMEYLERARDLSARRDLILVLTGRYTAICSANEGVYFNLSGNSGMASVGIGEILTGIITGLIARGYSPLNACIVGCYVHGLAGDNVARKYTEECLTASLLLEAIPETFHQIYHS